MADVRISKTWQKLNDVLVANGEAPLDPANEYIITGNNTFYYLNFYEVGTPASNRVGTRMSVDDALIYKESDGVLYVKVIDGLTILSVERV